MSNHKDDFARIERSKDGGQVLLYKATEENGSPGIVIVSAYKGVTLKMIMGYHDTDDGFDLRDSMFENFTQEQIDKARELVITAVDGE